MIGDDDDDNDDDDSSEDDDDDDCLLGSPMRRGCVADSSAVTIVTIAYPKSAVNASRSPLPL